MDPDVHVAVLMGTVCAGQLSNSLRSILYLRLLCTDCASLLCLPASGFVFVLQPVFSADFAFIFSDSGRRQAFILGVSLLLTSSTKIGQSFV